MPKPTRTLDDTQVYLPLMGDPKILDVNDAATRLTISRNGQPPRNEIRRTLIARRACQYAVFLAKRDHGLPLDQIEHLVFNPEHSCVTITHKAGMLRVKVSHA